NPAVETATQQGWINPIDEMPQPALAWNAVMKLREMPQEGEMVFAPGDDVIEIVAGGDRGTGHQQQDLLERIHNAPGLAVILELGKMPQKQGKTRTRDLLVEDLVHDGAPANQERPRNHTASSTQNHSGQAVNLASEPWPPLISGWQACARVVYKPRDWKI